MKLCLTLLFLSGYAMAFDHNHTKFNEVLQKYTKAGSISTLFDYKNLSNDKQKFISYLNDLENLSKSEFDKFTNDQKLAFWINAYNAYTIQLIIKNYPVDSIKDIKAGGLLSAFSSPWKIKFIKLLGKELTLDNIEHDIIRKNFSEPRIHFAVNCASMGCPSLRNEAFVASKLEEQLQDSSLKFLTNEKKNRIDPKKKKVYLSKIFKWYGSDFDKKYGSYLNFISKNHPSKTNIEKFGVSWTDYGWDLNE